jgi:MinD-like ATPase involved in chromosome partitioning or flagellar assembly
LNQIEDVLKRDYRTIVKSKKKIYIFGDPKAILKRISGLYNVAIIDCGCDLAYEYAEFYDANENVLGIAYYRKH